MIDKKRTDLPDHTLRPSQINIGLCAYECRCL